MVDIPVNENDGIVTVVIDTAGQTECDFDFLVYNADGVAAIYVRQSSGVRTALSYPDDFTVNGLGNPNGGSINLTSILDSVVGDQVVIYRSTPIKRMTDFQPSGDYQASVVNREEDEQIMIMQELRRDIDRATKVELGEEGVDIDRIPEGHFYVADADGNLVDGGDAGDIGEAQENAAAAAAAAAEAIQAKEDAEAAAAGLNLPALTGADARKRLRVKADGSGYDLVPGQRVAGSASLAGLKAIDTSDNEVAVYTNGDKGGLFKWDATVPVATHQGTGENAIYYPPDDGQNGAFVKFLGDQGVDARDFDVGPNRTGAQNSAFLQRAIDYAIANNIGLVNLPAGDLPFATQVVATGGPGVRARLNVRGQGNRTKLISSVAGAAVGIGATAGYLFIVDGLRHSRWYDFEIDYTAGNGGIRVQCRNESAFYNDFSGVRFVGGNDPTMREVNNRRSMLFVGNEAVANSPGYVTYFNWTRQCSFNIAYKHLEYLIGDGDPGTAEPNANNSENNLFERYIQAVDLTAVDECIHKDNWFQQGQGVAGINGGFTHAYKFNGYGHRLTGTVEPGPGGKAFTMGAASLKNQIIMVDNVSVGYDDASAGDNLIILKSKIMLPDLEMRAPIKLRAYSLGGLPSASPAGQVTYVTNEIGGPTLVYSDGTNWRRVADGAIAA